MKKTNVLTVALLLILAIGIGKAQELDSGVNRPVGQILAENLCEDPRGGVTVQAGAVDGSQYYQVNDRTDIPALQGNSMDLLVWVMDDQEGAGFTPMGNGERWGTCVRSRTMNGKYQLTVQTGGNSYTPYIEIDPSQWYYIELMGKYSSLCIC